MNHQKIPQPIFIHYSFSAFIKKKFILEDVLLLLGARDNLPVKVLLFERDDFNALSLSLIIIEIDAHISGLLKAT